MCSVLLQRAPLNKKDQEDALPTVINEVAHALLPHIVARERTPPDLPAEGSEPISNETILGLGKIESRLKEIRSPSKRARPTEMEKAFERRMRQRTDPEEARRSDDCSLSHVETGTNEMSGRSLGRLEAMMVVAHFFAQQAQGEQKKVGKGGSVSLVREYVRAIAILSDVSFGDQPSALLRDEWQWDRQRRRCLVWMRKTLYGPFFHEADPS